MKCLAPLSVAVALAACNPGNPIGAGPIAPAPVASPPAAEAPPVDVATAAVEEQPGPAANKPPEDPVEFTAPDGMRTYYIVLLKRGPKWSAERTPENAALGRGHMQYIAEQAKAGTLRVAGPFLGQTDADDYAGIYIYNVGSLEQAKALVGKDPAVAAGRFEPVYLVWMASKGLRVNPLTTDPTKPPTAATCTGDRHKDFDFWLGDWQVKNTKGEIVGTNIIEKSQSGCVLTEHWTSAKGSTGTSINYFDPARKVWLQTWVDSRGGVINLEGAMEEGAMKLGGSYTKADGKSTLLRGSWTPQPDGKVRQVFEESTDGGLTWTPWFDGTYERHPD